MQFDNNLNSTMNMVDSQDLSEGYLRLIPYDYSPSSETLALSGSSYPIWQFYGTTLTTLHTELA